MLFRSRYIRDNIKPFLLSEYKENFIDKQQGLAEEVLATLHENLTRETINTVLRKEGESPLISKMARDVTKYGEKLKKSELKEKPLKQLSKSYEFLQLINSDIIPKMERTHLEKMQSILNEMEELLETLRDVINAE